MADEKEKMHAVPPVAGYKPLTDSQVQRVNDNKRDEENQLRMLDAMKGNDAYDQRWLSIARTHFEEGYMALNRSIFKPGRVNLDG